MKSILRVLCHFVSRICCRFLNETGKTVASALVTFTILTILHCWRRTVADWQLTCTEVSFNACCYIIITSPIASVLGIGALTFSPHITCSVALNVKTRMSFWIVRWERGSAPVVSHRRSVLLHDILGGCPLGLLRCGQEAPKRNIRTDNLTPHYVPPNTFSVQQLLDCFGRLWSNGHGWAHQIANIGPWSIKILNDQTKKMHVLLVGGLWVIYYDCIAGKMICLYHFYFWQTKYHRLILSLRRPSLHLCLLLATLTAAICA